MKSSIVILGSHGMLGWQVLKEFCNSKFKVKCQVRNKKSVTILKKKLKLKNNVDFFF